MCNFEFFEYEEVLNKILFSDYHDEKKNPNLDLRMRLRVDMIDEPVREVYKGGQLKSSVQMSIENYHVLNEIVVDRGPSPYAI